MDIVVFNIMEVIFIILSALSIGLIATNLILYFKYYNIMGHFKRHMSDETIHTDYSFRHALENHLWHDSPLHITAAERILIKNHMRDKSIHITSEDKKLWDAKQPALTISQLEAIKKVQAGQPVQYMSYESTMKYLDNFIKLTFHKKWVEEILPSLTDIERDSIARLSPNDKTYSKFITTIFMEICVSMPFYLKKSVCFYFGVELENFQNTENHQTQLLLSYIMDRVTSIMNSTLLDLSKKIELSGRASTSAFDVTVDARNKLNELMFNGGTVDDIKSPDGTEVEIR